MSPVHADNRILLCGVSSVPAYALLRIHGTRLRALRSPHSRQLKLRQLPEFRFENSGSARQSLGPVSPEILIYTHAVCDVPKCEADPDWAREVNVHSIRRLLTVLPSQCRLVYLSSDHVFRGDGSYTESDPVSPISVYGRTRVEAERAVLSRANTLIIRAGLPLGPSPDGRTGHIDWLRYRSRTGLPITLVADESRSVVGGEDLANRILALSQSTVTGIRHVPARDFVSRPRLAGHLLHVMGLTPKVSIGKRTQQPAPHIGRIELKTAYADDFSDPLPSVLVNSIPRVRAARQTTWA